MHKAKKQVLFSTREAALHLFVSPTSLESWEGGRKFEGPIIGLETKPVGANGQLTVAIGCSTLIPETAGWHQRPLAANRKDSRFSSRTGYQAWTEV